MISKTSFFNKGIYKSIVKRYAWGSALYFIILFVSTGLLVFLNTDRDYSYLSDDYFINNPMILNNTHIIVPMLLAIVAPTVVALLIFRFIHSKKQSIFIHSLPVSRKANYISSILASLTLMSVPVILNGAILILISLCGYGDYFTVANCLEWIGYNLLGMYLMFSVAVFSANLTGNSFATIAINVLIHAFLFITVATLGIMAEAFIYGFNESYVLYERIAEKNFDVFVFGLSNRYFCDDITVLQIVTNAVAALVLYIGSYFLYKKRRLETATDVAGYKCLNPIFKYIVSFMATMFGFAIFAYYIAENTLVFALIVAIISIIVYAAAEMVLKKTVNVLYSWKGYVGFAVFFIALTALFSQTSFFGYETRIPEKADISEATVYNYYHQEDEPFTVDSETIDMVIATHKELIADGNIPKVKGETAVNTRLHIKYKLKNGETLYRIYPVTSEQCVDIMDRFYEIEEYKKKCEKIFIDDSRITKVYISDSRDDTIVEDYKELLSAIRDDILNLSYGELYYPEKGYNNLYNIRIEYETGHTFEEDGETRSIINSVFVDVNDKYEKTLKWLADNGYNSIEYTD